MTFSMPNLECLEAVSFAVQPAEVLFVEVFCRAAGLSKAAQASGLSVMPIDRVSNTQCVSSLLRFDKAAGPTHTL